MKEFKKIMKNKCFGQHTTGRVFPFHRQAALSKRCTAIIAVLDMRRVPIEGGGKGLL